MVLLKIKAINPIDHLHWNREISHLAGASIFHTADWAGVLAESYGYRPVYVCAFQADQLVGCLPLMDVRSVITGRRGVSLPFSDECRPLGGDDAFDAIWQYAVGYGLKAGWGHIELRGAHARCIGRPTFASFLTHDLNLERPEAELYSRLRGSTRRNIVKAAKQKLKIERTRSMEGLKAFYRLNCMTRKRHGLPPQPFRFFECIHKRILADGKGFILTAVKSGSVIAAAVFFSFKETMIYKYSASDKEFQHLRANNLIMWEAIKQSIQEGCRRFNFGRTEPDNIGLLQFKRGWGAQESGVSYLRYDIRKRVFGSERPSLKGVGFISSKIPQPLLTAAGRLLYRHIA